MREGTMPMLEPDQGLSVHPSFIPANQSFDSCSQAQEGRTAVGPSESLPRSSTGAQPCAPTP